MRLISVDLPAFGRPTIAARSGFVGSSSEPSSSSPSFIRQRLADRVVEIGETLAMLRGERNGLTQAEIISLEGTRFAGAALGFVCDEDQRLIGPAQQRGEMPIIRGETGAGIGEEQHRVRVGHGGLRLRPHAPGERCCAACFQSGSIDDGEG
jgi:hypothetical protein